jgi:mannitol-1-phosphate/altronate dehydrogenase
MSNTVKEATSILKEVLNNTNFKELPFTKELLEKAVNLLESQSKIFIEWSTEDVFACAEMFDREIPTQEEAEKILSIVEDSHDCNYGITWEHFLQVIIDNEIAEDFDRVNI